jgi:hypothetical protein
VPPGDHEPREHQGRQGPPRQDIATEPSRDSREHGDTGDRQTEQRASAWRDREEGWRSGNAEERQARGRGFIGGESGDHGGDKQQ